MGFGSGGGKFGSGRSDLDSDLTIDGSVKIKEGSAADADIAGQGQLWVKSDAPNNLYFTDDTGQDVQITANGSLAGVAGSLSGLGSTDNVILRSSGTGGETAQGSGILIDDSNNFTIPTTAKIQFRDTGLFINSSANGQLDVDADTELELTAPTVDIDASTTLTVDTAVFSIDGTDDSNLTVTASGKDLDLAVAGGGTQELRLASAGTGAAAIHLNASAGGIDIDSADMIDIDAADEITIDTTSADGHIAVTSAHTAGQAILISANADAGSILDIDAGIIDIDVQDTISIDAADEIEIATTSADGHITLTSAHTAGVAFHIDANADAASELQIDAGVLDIDVTAGITIDGTTISIDGTDDTNITVTGSAKDLDLAVAGGGTQELRIASAGTGTAAIHLNASAGGIDIDSADMIDIDAADEITIDTTSADGHIAVTSAHTAGQAILISANADAGSILDIDAGIIDIDVQAGVTLDATTISIDGTDDSNITVTGSAKDLDLAVAGGGTQELRIASAGTGTAAIHLNASAGGIDIDSADMIDIDAADEITITTTSADGHISLVSAHTAGVALHIDADANAGSILDIDAGIVDMDVTGAITMTAGGLLKTEAAGVEIENASDSGAPALLIDHDDVDAIALDIDADNTTGNVIDINAGALTTGKVINIAGTVLGKNPIVMDHNYSDTSNATITCIDIDFDKTGASSGANTITGIKLDMDNSTMTGGTNVMKGMVITPTLINDSGAGAATVFGIDITATGGTQGNATVARGLNVVSTDADYNQGIHITSDSTRTGWNHLKLLSSEDTGDFCTIKVGTHGETTIETVDDDAAAAHLNLLIDGEVRIQTPVTNMAADSVLGTLSFQAPLEGTGTDAILVAAGIAAVSEGDFSSSNNATKLSFKTAASETAAEKMALTSGGDLKLVTDSAVLGFGADNEITLTHVHDTGLTLKHTATADDKPITLTLATGETNMEAGDVIGKIAFSAPDEETGTDAILTSALIQAVAEGDHSSSSNATRLEFYTAASEAAGSAGGGKLELSSTGNLTLKDTRTADNSAPTFTLQAGDDNIASGDILGKIAFQAPDEGAGTDAILVAAAIQAVSEGDFAADNNATKLEFMVGASEAAATKMTLSSGGVLDVDGGITVDNITIDGTEIDLSSGDLTLDVAGDIVLDAGGGNVKYSVAGTQILDIGNSSSDVIIKQTVNQKNLIFQQQDGLECARVVDGMFGAGEAPVTNAIGLSPGFGYRTPVMVLNAASGDVAVTLTAAESGYTILLVSAANAITVTLPALTAETGLGLHYKFVCVSAVAGDKEIQIKTAGAGADNNDNFFLHNSIVAGATSFDGDGDTLQINSNTAAGAIVECLAISSDTNVDGSSTDETWLAEAKASVAVTCID